MSSGISEEDWVFLSFVDPSLIRTHLDGHVVDSASVVRLLEYRAIPAGTPVFLDELTMRPVWQVPDSRSGRF